MRPMIRIFVFAGAVAGATAAFASETMTVNVPFSFETHGKVFPAGKYQVAFDSTENVLILSRTNTRKCFMWVVSPAEYSPKMARLSLNFENEADGTHELRSIRLATWETPVLDKRERHAAQPEQSIVSSR